MIYFGSDHAGFELKEELKKHLLGLGYQIEDKGAFKYNPDDDYPDFVLLVAQAVAKNSNKDLGIVIGGSGQGEAMATNKISGIRAIVLYNYNEEIIKLSKQHNNANVLSLGARFISVEDAKKAVKLWLETKFSEEERHKRRILKINHG